MKQITSATNPHSHQHRYVCLQLHHLLFPWKWGNTSPFGLFQVNLYFEIFQLTYKSQRILVGFFSLALRVYEMLHSSRVVTLGHADT